MDTESNERSRALALINGGAELAGAAIGGAVGLVGGPPGALGGAAAGVAAVWVLSKIGSEVHDRILGPRQRIRAGAALAFAADEINRRLGQGDQPRADGFFGGTDERSNANELLEGVLLQAGNAYQERKVRHLGWLYASIVFDTQIDAAYANYLLLVAERLTYRQLVWLAMLARGSYVAELTGIDVAREEGTGEPRASCGR